MGKTMTNAHLMFEYVKECAEFYCKTFKKKIESNNDQQVIDEQSDKGKYESSVYAMRLYEDVLEMQETSPKLYKQLLKVVKEIKKSKEKQEQEN